METAVMSGINYLKTRIKRKTGTNHGASEPITTIRAFILFTDGGQPLLVGWVLPRVPVPSLRFGLGFCFLLSNGFPS